MQLSFAWIGLQLETSINQLYQSRDILNRNIFNVAVSGWFFCPSFVFVKVVKLLSLSQTFSCRRVFCIVMQHAHTMCTISFMVEYLSKVWWYTVTHIFFATFDLFLQIVFRCFDVFWFGFIDFAFEVITVPTTYVNETRYSFRLNVTVAELQDMKNQRSGKLMSSFTPAPSPFPCCENGHPMRDNRCCLELESNPKSRLNDSWISKCIQTLCGLVVRTMLRCSNRGHSLS